MPTENAPPQSADSPSADLQSAVAPVRGADVRSAVATKDALAQKTLKLLEFDVILDRLARHSMSEEAAEAIRLEEPSGDPAEVAKTKSVVRAIISRIQGGGGDPRKSLPAIGFLLPRLGVEGSALELDEACAIGLFAERGEELRKWLQPHPVLAGLFADMPDCGGIAAAVFRAIDREGNVRDLPELRAIRQKIRALKSGLDALVSRYAASEEIRRMLQSAVPSQRDGRIVLAVKSNFRGRIRGIVHEVSASGQTIFVEPEDVVERNNDILIETRNLDAEIRRILAGVTAAISERGADLRAFHAAALRLEALMAKARYSLETAGRFSPDAPAGAAPLCINLIQARHPLLRSAVPIDLSMAKAPDDGGTQTGGAQFGNAQSDDAQPGNAQIGNTRTSGAQPGAAQSGMAQSAGVRALIITGPNTGGKTVALKTAGLFAMMNQIGLAIPAAEGSALPVFDRVFADIGDEQSIGQSLSTFSAHVANVAGIIAHSTASSLALLDELGSGTEPQEGGAIAMAILDRLIEKGATLLITTHHGILKNYGYTRREVENASVEFDTRTLSPTYRIITGLPGESRALEIAERNGLPGGVIAGARRYVDSGHSDVSALIGGLKEKRRELDALAQSARLEESRLRDERRKSDLKELRLRQKELELKAGLAGRLRLLLDESRKTLENLVRELREGEITREKTLKVKDFLGDLARAVEAEDAILEAEKRAIAEERLGGAPPPGGEGASAGAAAFAPGMEVLAGESRRRGTLVRRGKKSPAGKTAGNAASKAAGSAAASAAGGTWIVEIGSLKISFPESELVPAAPSPPPKPQAASVDYAAPPAARAEINLRGMRMEEALEALRRQLDAAVLCGLSAFSVVHGKGDGVLQKAVHERLKKEPAVADYFFSHPELGGFGRTEVVLR